MSQIMTVRGPVPAAQLGRTLPHEHVMVDFIGADQVGKHRVPPAGRAIDPAEVCRVMLPFLAEARAQDWTGFVDCTPAYIGRDPELLHRLSESADLHILTNTGYYKEPYLPPHAFTDTVDELADRWVREFEDGIDGTGMRPGFIKIAVNPGPLVPIQQKIVRAAARAHRRTGLAVASHTVAGVAALEELDLAAEEGMDLGRFIVVHADGEPDRSFHREIARRGAWVEFDGIGWRPIAEHVELILDYLEQCGPDRLLLSHDAGWYWVGEPNGGQQRPFTPLAGELLPALAARGVGPAVLDQLVRENPARAFAVG